MAWIRGLGLACMAMAVLVACASASADATIDRQAVVERHAPTLDAIDWTAPMTVGNGRFAFTAGITGLQDFADHYFEHGIPLETKARWAWHTPQDEQHHVLGAAMETWDAYGREVPFPTDDRSTAGQWLRRNPHDLPLVRISLALDGEPLEPDQLGTVQQRLDPWRGRLSSRFELDGEMVNIETTATQGPPQAGAGTSGQPYTGADIIAFRVSSALLGNGRLAIAFTFPRGYDLDIKNTPDVILDDDDAHHTRVSWQHDQGVGLARQVDDALHGTAILWQGEADFETTAAHRGRLRARGTAIDVQVALQPDDAPSMAEAGSFDELAERAADSWRAFWQSGAAIDLGGSTDPRAAELERRLVLSQYLLAAQSRAAVPAQETGLTSSSWYGKHHTEMAWWHSAHWILWHRYDPARQHLDWFRDHIDVARATARQRGLDGARWSKMVGPEGRESPGGNPLIIWNQPQPIHLADMLWRASGDPAVLERYAVMVDDTAAALASMLVDDNGRWSLGPPIWIAQEIHDPASSANPAFELAYWRLGLDTAIRWRQVRGLPVPPQWRERLDALAALPTKDGRYVAMESIPDTFDNIEARQDHPTMLAPWGLLADDRVDPALMQATLDAVLAEWDFEGKIWGWDYPMIAMTAARLGHTELALDLLVRDAPHNRYLANGHVPQPGAALPVYLPANGALLSAAARIFSGEFAEPGQAAVNVAGWSYRSEGLRRPWATGSD
ncbi:hypothetical protein F3N42_05485 [Marinihelvus fidelis]|uniref:Glycoside hydrolase family 65 n=2 Tax=Marinihelvus fidelis TaxID=2613842 RepID=A0A5N0TH96_9GAMM|nr:hypothetical protein F3N42_05485 [Marinihelvus fidelis]